MIEQYNKNKPIFFIILIASLTAISLTWFDLFPKTTSPRESGIDEPRMVYIDFTAKCGSSYDFVKNKLEELTDSKTTIEAFGGKTLEIYLWDYNGPAWLQNVHVVNKNLVLITKVPSTASGVKTFHLLERRNEKSCADPRYWYNHHSFVFASSFYYGAKRQSEKSLTLKSVPFESLDVLEWHQSLGLRTPDSVYAKMDLDGPETTEILEKMLNDETNQICYWYVLMLDSRHASPQENFHEIFSRQFYQKCGKKIVLTNIPSYSSIPEILRKILKETLILKFSFASKQEELNKLTAG